MNAYLPDIEESEGFIRKNEFKKAAKHFDDLSREYSSNDLGKYINATTLFASHQIFLGLYASAEKLLKHLLDDIEKKDYEGLINRIGFLEGQLRHYLGILYFKKGKYWKAITFLKDAIDIKLNAPKPSPKENLFLADSYFELSKIYCILGDYDQSVSHLNRALISYVNPKSQEFDYRYGRALIELGVIFWFKDELSKALFFFRKAKRELLRIGLDKKHFFFYLIETNLGLYHWKLGKQDKKNYVHFKKSEDAYKRGLKILETTFPEGNHLEYGVLYNNWGVACASQNDLSKHNEAFQHYRIALKILIESLGEKHPKIGRVYYDRGFLYFLEGLPKAALENYQLAIYSVVDNFDPDNLKYPHRNPAIEDIIQVNSFRVLINALERKAFIYTKLLLQKKPSTIIEKDDELDFDSGQDLPFEVNLIEGEEEWLLYTKNTIEKAYSLFRQISQFLYEKGTRFFYHKKLSAICDYALKIYWYEIELTDNVQNLTIINKAFRIFEFSKELFVLEDFYEQKTKRDNHDYRELKKEIDRIGLSLLKLIHHRKISLTQYNQFDSTAKIEKYDKFLHAHFTPNLKRNPSERTEINTLQKSLENEKAAVISFFAGSDHYYVFVIKKTTQYLYRLNESKKTVNQKIKELKKILLLSFKDIKRDSRLESFKKSSHYLFQQLLKPYQNLLDGVERVYLIPDGEISDLPFDVLIESIDTESNSEENLKAYKSLKYLLHQDYTFSYHYSATILSQTYLKKQIPPSDSIFDIIGFAPIKYNGNLDDLPKSEEHIKTIEELFQKSNFKIKTFTKKEATLAEFKKHIADCTIFHIVAHTKNDPDGSEIYFFNEEKLQVLDVLSLTSMKVELVFLVGCTSGSVVQNAEIKTLNRAFLVAEAQNIIYTLVDIPDAYPIYNLVNYFYKKIIAGETYSKALKLAKLEALNDDYEALPIYWGNLIFIGNQTHKFTAHH